jgi:hypothetical protein
VHRTGRGPAGVLPVAVALRQQPQTDRHQSSEGRRRPSGGPRPGLPAPAAGRRRQREWLGDYIGSQRPVRADPVAGGALTILHRPGGYGLPRQGAEGRSPSGRRTGGRSSEEAPQEGLPPHPVIVLRAREALQEVARLLGGRTFGPPELISAYGYSRQPGGGGRGRGGPPPAPRSAGKLIGPAATESSVRSATGGRRRFSGRRGVRSRSRWRPSPPARSPPPRRRRRSPDGLLGQVEVRPHFAVDDDRDAEEGVHRRMGERKPVGVRVSRSNKGGVTR